MKFVKSSFFSARRFSEISQVRDAQPFIQYRASKYSVPWEFCFKTIYYKVIGDKLHVYGPDRRHECTHQVNPVRGSSDRLEEHRRQKATDWMDVAERLRAKWNCAEFQHLNLNFPRFR